MPLRMGKVPRNPLIIRAEVFCEHVRSLETKSSSLRRGELLKNHMQILFVRKRNDMLPLKLDKLSSNRIIEGLKCGG